MDGEMDKVLQNEGNRCKDSICAFLTSRVVATARFNLLNAKYME